MKMITVVLLAVIAAVLLWGADSVKSLASRAFQHQPTPREARAAQFADDAAIACARHDSVAVRDTNTFFGWRCAAGKPAPRWVQAAARLDTETLHQWYVRHYGPDAPCPVFGQQPDSFVGWINNGTGRPEYLMRCK